MAFPGEKDGGKVLRLRDLSKRGQPVQPPIVFRRYALLPDDPKKEGHAILVPRPLPDGQALLPGRRPHLPNQAPVCVPETQD